jgi:hypothetical protein
MSRRLIIAIADPDTGVERRAVVSPVAALVTLGVLLTSPVLIGIGVAWKVSTDTQRLNARHRALEIERANYRAAAEALAGRIESLQGSGSTLATGANGPTNVVPRTVSSPALSSLALSSATFEPTSPVQERSASHEAESATPTVAPLKVAERVDVESTVASTERDQLSEVLTRLSQKRALAEEANAQTLASRAYQEAIALELEARQFAGMGRTDEALVRALVTEVRFRMAESEARTQSAAAQDASRVLAAETVERASQGQRESSRSASAAAARTAEAEHSVRSVIAEYVSGLESRDLATLKRVWPTLGGSQEKALRTEFENARAVRALFSDPRITINDDTTTVTGVRSYRLETQDGQHLSTTTRTTITLRRRDDTWVIERVVHRP